MASSNRRVETTSEPPSMAATSMGEQPSDHAVLVRNICSLLRLSATTLMQNYVGAQ